MSDVMVSCRSVVALGLEPTVQRSFAFVAPRHADGSDWPWLSQIGSIRRNRVQAIYIENTFRRFPKATRLYVRWQHLRALHQIRRHDLAFLFSTSIACGMTSWPFRLLSQQPRIYVGFTQDGEWPRWKITRLQRALRQCDAVTVFSEDERDLYIDRFRLDPRRVHVIPIHTDEMQEYLQYPDERPPELPKQPFVLSLGSPNRRFTPVARACRELNIPLVVITRPTHTIDSLSELADLGATIITNADKMKALTYLKHARMGVMAFQTPTLPGAFTTLIHAMFLRTPCVVTSCLGVGDYVVDEQTGLIVPHGDENALRTAIDRLWQSPALHDRFVASGLERAERLFSLEAAACRFRDLAEHVLANTVVHRCAAR